MPAPNSRLKELKERKPFAPVDTAIILYKKTLDICLRMPKRYTYLLLKDTIELAGEVMDYTKKANSIFAHNPHEVEMRIDYWLQASASLQALSTRIDRFVEVKGSLQYHDERTGKTKGVSLRELEEILDIIIKEQSLITNTINSERKQHNY